MTAAAAKPNTQLKRPLAFAVVFFTAAQAVFLSHGETAAAAGLGLSGLLLACSLLPKRRSVSLALRIAALAWICSAVFSLCIFAQERRELAFTAGQEVDCELVVTARHGSRAEALVVAAAGQRISGLHTVLWLDGVFPGDTLAGSFRFAEAEKAERDGAFVLPAEALTYEVVDGRETLSGVLYRFRQRFSAALRQLLAGDEGALAVSAVTGDTTVLSPSLKQTVVRAGLGDMLAVSGMHVGLLLGFALALLRGRRGTALAAMIPLAALLLVFYGFAPSVCRAVCVQLVCSFGRVLRRRADALTSLSAAVLALELLQPYSVFELSFLMSVSCCIGLYVLGEPFARRLGEAGRSGAPRRLLPALAGQLGASACASAALVPCYLVARMPLPLLSPFSSAAVGFLMLPQLICAFLAGILQMLAPFGLAARLLGLAAGILSRCILLAARFFSGFAAACVNISLPWVRLAAVFLVFSLVLALRRRVPARLACTACALLLVCGTASRICATRGRIRAGSCYDSVVVSQNGCAALILADADARELASVAAYCDARFLGGVRYVIMEHMDAAQAARIEALFPAAVRIDLSDGAHGVLLLADARLLAEDGVVLCVADTQLPLFRAGEPSPLFGDGTLTLYLQTNGDWKALSE